MSDDFDPDAYLTTGNAAPATATTFDPDAHLDQASPPAADSTTTKPTRTKNQDLVDKNLYGGAQVDDTSWWKKILGLGETGAHVISGGAASLLEGFKNALGGNTSQDLIDADLRAKGLPTGTTQWPVLGTSEQRQDGAGAITYSGHTAEGRKDIADVYASLATLGAKPGAAAGDRVLDLTGSPLLAAGANTALNLPQFLAGDGLSKIRGGEVPARPVAAPFDPEYRSPVDPQDLAQRAQAALNANIAQQSQSMGAAAAARDITGTPKEFQAAVADAAQNGPIHPGALERQTRAQSLPVPTSLTEGQATRDPQLYSDELNKRADPATGGIYTKKFAEQAQNLKDNMDAIRQEATPDIVQRNQLEHGQELIDMYKTQDAVDQAAIRQKYQALTDANGGQFPIGGRTLVENIDKALESANREGVVPSDLASTLNKFRDGSRQMTFNDYETLRSDAADAMRSATNGRERSAANIIRQQTEDLPLLPGAEGLKGLADDARQAAKSRFDRIEADPAYGAAVNDGVKAGEASPLADDFVKKYVINGKRANIETMKDNLPAAADTIEAATLNHLKDSSGMSAKDVFQQNGYNGALKQLGPKLDAMVKPETLEQVHNLGQHARDIQTSPPGASVNSSNSWVAAMGELAKSGIEKMVDAKTAGSYSLLKSVLPQNRAGLKAAQEATKPGAGLNYVDPNAPTIH